MVNNFKFLIFTIIFIVRASTSTGQNSNAFVSSTPENEGIHSETILKFLPPLTPVILNYIVLC